MSEVKGKGDTRPGRKPLTPEERQKRAEVRKIADIIGEQEGHVLKQIRRILDRRGLDFIKQRLRETHEIHKAGGMYMDDRKRKRTVGGIFFHQCRLHWMDDVVDIEADLAQLKEVTE